jgi:hypothetical protein
MSKLNLKDLTAAIDKAGNLPGRDTLEDDAWKANREVIAAKKALREAERTARIVNERRHIAAELPRIQALLRQPDGELALKGLWDEGLANGARRASHRLGLRDTQKGVSMLTERGVNIQLAIRYLLDHAEDPEDMDF